MKVPLLLLVLLGGAHFAGAADFITGIGTHMRSLDEIPLIAKSGVKSFRMDLYWSDLEVEKGVLRVPQRYDDYVNQARRAGLQPLLILCYGNKFYDRGDFPRSPKARAAYTRYCTFAARHFRGKVRLFEVWNEWNWGTGVQGEKGDPESYVQLLRGAYRALKAVDRRIVVLGGATSNTGLRGDWLPRACEAGLLDYLDGYSFHPYCWGASGRDREPELGVGGRIAKVIACLDQYPRGRSRPLYITEIGWPTHQGADGGSEPEVANFLEQTFALAATEKRVRGLWWYALRDDGKDRTEAEHNFGVVTADLNPKATYASLLRVPTIVSKARASR